MDNIKTLATLKTQEITKEEIHLHQDQAKEEDLKKAGANRETINRMEGTNSKATIRTEVGNRRAAMQMRIIATLLPGRHKGNNALRGRFANRIRGLQFVTEKYH